MDEENQLNREALKSVLTCLDDYDFKKGLLEIKRLEKSIDPVIRVFLEFIFIVCKDSPKEASTKFRELITILDLEIIGGKNDIDARIIKQICVLIWMGYQGVQPNFLDQFKNVEEDNILENESLQESTDYPNIRSIKQIKEVLFHIVENKAKLLSESGHSVVSDLFPVNLSKRPIECFTAVFIYENYFSKVSSLRFVVHLFEIEVMRLVMYDSYCHAFANIVEKNKDAKFRNEILSRLKSFVSEIEPRKDNLSANGRLYQFAKPLLNKLVFNDYSEKRRLEEGFEWVESDSRGMDFLRTDDIPYKHRLIGDYVRKEFIIDPEYFPYNLNRDLARYHDVVYGNPEELVYDLKVRSFYSVLDIYNDFLAGQGINSEVRRLIEDRILIKCDEMKKWADTEINIKSLAFPSFVADFLFKRKQYDDAIQYYYSSDLPDDKRIEAIDKCKRERDGFIYDELKETLRHHKDENEQWQIIGYCKIFQIELRFRKVIDEELTKHHGNPNWWRFFVSEKINTDCNKRKTNYVKNIWDKETKSKPHLINFTTLPELHEIVKNHFEIFRPCFINEDRFNGCLASIINIRLDIAHIRIIDREQLQTLKDECDKLNRILDNYNLSTKT